MSSKLLLTPQVKKERKRKMMDQKARKATSNQTLMTSHQKERMKSNSQETLPTI